VGEDLRLKLYCKDPSKQLNEALKRSRAAIFYSATMTPTAYFQNIFGCEETVRGLVLPSPFPREHLRLVVSDHISTLYRKREETKEALTEALVEFVSQKKGNYMLYFPSYEYLGKVHSLFTAERPDMDVLAQTPEMTETEREQFLRNFSHDNDVSLVGFAVMGGVFGEGIDLVGDRLTGAAIVGVGLPGISPERELIREYFDQQGTGFEYAYLYPGINRVLQAAGRVIRSENDKGVVLLIDPRFTRSPYRTLLPSFWQPQRVTSEDQLRSTLAGFWME
jgi:DNA excision repair protein ERCC-2